VGAAATELGKKIEGARDDNGSRRARQLESAAPGGVRIGKCLDMVVILDVDRNNAFANQGSD